MPYAPLSNLIPSSTNHVCGVQVLEAETERSLRQRGGLRLENMELYLRGLGEAQPSIFGEVRQQHRTKTFFLILWLRLISRDTAQSMYEM